MKALILTSSLCIFLQFALKAEKSASNQPRVPVIPIERAIKLVYDHHNNKPDVKPVFIDEVVYVREAEKSFWKVGVRIVENETGHLYYALATDEKITIHSVVKDG